MKKTDDTVRVLSPDLVVMQATVHRSLGNWLHLQSTMGVQLSPRRGRDHTVQGAMGFPSALLWSSRGFISFGSLIIALQVQMVHTPPLPLQHLSIGHESEECHTQAQDDLHRTCSSETTYTAQVV